jgi:CMP-N-acetylneuraminic acid synthetase
MLAFLPIKEHSARIPGKNFRLLRDKPLFMWIIDALLLSKGIDEIIIDTDSTAPELLDLRKNQRITIKERNFNLRGDHVSMNLLLKDFILSTTDETFLMTHATNPFISQKTIEEAILEYSKALSSGHDSLVSVDKFHSRFYDDTFSPINHDPKMLLRTQDLSPIYQENSCLYIFTKKSFLGNQNNRVGSRPLLFETPKLESIDIDTEEDWTIAEIIAKYFVSDCNTGRVGNEEI